MKPYLILLRGINVGGKNKIAMAVLKECLEALGFQNVTTYIQSGNVLVWSNVSATTIAKKIETMLPQKFKLDSSLIKVLVLTREQLQTVVDKKPRGFGEQPDTYHSDAIFLMNIGPTEAMQVFHPREGVDQVWPGEGVIYSQRLSAQRTKSRLGKIVGTPAYQSMTIRSWNTTTKLLMLMRDNETLR